jgi:hypothetical protein
LVPDRGPLELAQGGVVDSMNRIDQYYICEGRDLDARDFGVPDFFAAPLPINLLTLAAHRAYNASFSLSDDYVRTILAGLRSEKAQWWKSLDEGTAPSIVSRHPHPIAAAGRAAPATRMILGRVIERRLRKLG